MKKEKLTSLTKYMDLCKERLKSPVPEKHKGHLKSFHEFLNNEINKVKAKIDAAVIEGVK